MPYQKRAQKVVLRSTTLQRGGEKKIYKRNYLVISSHFRFFPLLCRPSSSRKDQLFHNHQSKQSLVSWGFASHVFIPPRTTSCASPPTPLWFIFPFLAIPPFPTSGPHIWRSERQLACGCFQALRLLTDTPDRQRWSPLCRRSSWEDMDGGVSSLLSHHFQQKKVETWYLWELLSVCHTGMKLAKGINVMWALPKDRGEAVAETKLKYERTERHSWGNHFHFINYPSP